MQNRKLGNTEFVIAPLAFGGNVFGWTVNDEMVAFQLLDSFVSAGFSLIDTSDFYSAWIPGNKGGESETMIGHWMKKRGNREKVIIATKVGLEMGPNKKGLSKRHILEAVNDSLQRFQTDYIDLYQSHIDDTETPLEETLAAYSELLNQGKIRAIGASNYSVERLKKTLSISEQYGYPFYQTLQPLYNLCERTTYETTLEPFCVMHQLGVIPYYSLASGFLTGKYRHMNDLSKSSRGSAVKKYLNEKGFRILDALDQVANQYHATKAQIALAWTLSHQSITAPIVSATSIKQLNELMQSTQLILDKNSIDLLNEASN